MTLPLLAVLVLGGAPAAPSPGIHWERSFEIAVQKAKSQRKALMVDFWAEWCGWCHRLDETTYVDPEVVRLSKDFVPVKVNTEGGRNETLVALKYNVSDLPTIVFVSPSGRPILRLSGFQGPGQFPQIMAAAREASNLVLGWEASLDKDPKDAAALLRFGVYLYEQEAYEESRDLLVQATRFDLGRPVEDRKQGRMMLGIIRHYEHRYPDAEALLKEALAMRPPGRYEAQLLYILGRTYKAWNRFDQARQVLKQVVDGYPESPFAQRAQETLLALDRQH
ncbi:MAG: thioredoxin family protein [Vicinamibacteria bacterium]